MLLTIKKVYFKIQTTKFLFGYFFILEGLAKYKFKFVITIYKTKNIVITI